MVGKSKCAVPTHMFKFVIATPESDNETLVTGSFVVPNQDDYCDKELKKGNEAFKYVFDNEVKTDIITIARDTGTQFDEMLSKNIHKYNEDLLQQCSFITAEEYKQYEEKHIKERMARKQKDKGVQKSAEKQNKNKNKC